MDNQVALTYILKMGEGDSQQEASRFGQRYLKLSTIQKDHDQYIISTKPPESGIRLAVKGCPRQQQVETLYVCVPKNLSENGYAQYRPRYVSNVTPTSLLHGLETRSGEQSNRCVATSMSTKVTICLPSI